MVDVPGVFSKYFLLGTGGMSQHVKYLPYGHEDLSPSVQILHKTSKMTAHACNPCPREAKTGKPS